MKILAFIIIFTIPNFSIDRKVSDACKTQINESFKKGISDTAIKAKVKLAQVVALPSECGVMMWVRKYKFEFLDSANVPMFPGKFINIKFTCPREMGLDFFQKGKIYNFFIQKEMNFIVNDSKNKQTKDSLPVYLYGGKY